MFIRFFLSHILACWSILLACYNGKVISYCPQAGKDLNIGRGVCHVTHLSLLMSMKLHCYVASAS